MSTRSTALRRRFQGWQVILVGAFIFAVWNKANFNALPAIATTVLNDTPILQAVAPSPPGFTASPMPYQYSSCHWSAGQSTVGAHAA